MNELLQIEDIEETLFPDIVPDSFNELVDDEGIERPTRPMLESDRAKMLRHAKTVVLLLAVYLAVNLTTARYVVEGPSMEPNFYTNQFIIVNRLSYLFHGPLRGDVIVFHNPEDPSHEFIKRVIGLPGETIRIEEGKIYINGARLIEPYINTICENERCDNTWTLDANHFFVLGDNRNQSRDSHNFGPVDRSLIIGQAWIRYWPPANWGVI